MRTLDDTLVNILSVEPLTLEETLLKNRNITPEEKNNFFTPHISLLADPHLMPDMDKAVDRILLARERSERIVIF
jgi:hypothetical protein